MQKKLLTISILVSGRKDTTEKCLNSLKNLRRRLDCELILVDTGCDKELRQTIESYADKIIDFTWCDDFAKARNAGLEQAEGEWFLYLDDDEWFESTKPISDFLLSEEAGQYDQAVYKVRNYSDIKGREYTEDWVSRMTRIEPDTHFVGKVHEYMTPARGKCRQIEAYVHHYGYAFTDDASRRRHFERNEPLLLEMIKEAPGNMQWRVQLVQEYANVKKADKLRQTGEAALDVIRQEDHPYINQCRGTFFNAVILGDILEEKYEDALHKIKNYVSDARNSAMCQCSLYNHGADCALKQKDYPAAEEYSRRYMELCKDVWEHPMKNEQERIIAESIIFVKDACTQDLYNKNLLLWAVSLIRQDKHGSITDEDREQIIEHIRSLLADNGNFLRLSKEVWEIGKARVVPLEDMLLNLEFSQWMAAVTHVTSRTTPAELDEIKKRLKGIQTKTDIRYDYYDMNYADMKVLTVETKEDDTSDYMSMRAHFRDFAEGMLKFYEQIYRPRAFEGEMEMLPDHCRAAVWIRRMLACGEQDWEEILACLKECAKAYPELGEQVKSLAVLIGKKQEQAAEEAQAAANELKTMAAQVVPKVIMLLDNGMAAEAYQIVQQLKQMLPNDQEIEQLAILVKSRLM